MEKRIWTSEMIERSRELRRDLFRVFAVSTAFFVGTALAIPAALHSFGLDGQLGGLYPELSAYCSHSACAVSPLTVSAVYAAHCAFTILFLLGITTKARMDFGANKDTTRIYKLVALCIPIAVLMMFFQPFGFERERVFSNYVHLYKIYLLLPAALCVIGCNIGYGALLATRFWRQFPDAAPDAMKKNG